MTREEAMNLVKQVLPCLNIDEKIREGFVTLIPELKESDDERIMKELIFFLKEEIPQCSIKEHAEKLKEFVSYLEKQQEQKSLNISAASEWLRKHVCAYMNSEYNEFHKCVEYDGSIDKERLVNDFEEAMRKEEKPRIDVDQLKSLMLQYLQEAANENDDSDIEADTDKWARKILGYGFEQKPVKCIEFENEFTKQVSHLLASVINKEWEYSKGFVEYAAQSLLGYAKHEMKSTATNGIEEYRNEVEFNPKPGEKFWVRCKTEKKDNLWFEKGDERPVYTIQGKDGIMYVVCLDKDGKGNAVSYQNKEKFLETFDILESKR